MSHKPHNHQRHCSPDSLPCKRPLTLAAVCSSALWCFCALFLLLLCLPNACLSAERTTVIYPDVPEPYKNIFNTILEGISTDSHSEIKHFLLPDNYQLEDIQQALEANRSDGIITLGKRGYLAAKELGTEIPVVSGALSMIPNGISGISLSADPEVLFSRLKTLAPNSRRIFVVYSEKNTGWLIPLAKAAAEKLGYLLIAYPAGDLRSAVRHYRTILDEARGPKDTIWLPLDRVTTHDDVVLPLLLQKAWDNDLIIISNKPSHAKRGALFAMYPDNFGLGQELTLLLDQLTNGTEDSKVIPLKRLNLAVNLRTASHLGLNFTPQQQEDFKVTFPAR